MSDPVKRFWSRVNKTGSCWLWTGKLTYKSYGGFYAELDGQKFYRAHRFSWHINRGSIPKGMHVLHNCDNPWCVNPDHLWLGTNWQNHSDKIAKGRQSRGEMVNTAKLTEDDVRAIMASGESGMKLAKRYDVHNSVIYNIRNGKTWKHITRQAE